LNEYADKDFPGKYRSDFAVQVTSRVPDAKQFTINFTNNSLSGSSNFDLAYKTSKTRVCVTVGMMTTGYDCPDLLNLCLMRPIFSPTDFIQIKGRGTRKHDFSEEITDPQRKLQVQNTYPGGTQKTRYKMFDFFANCEYFEEKFNYDEIVPLPKTGTGDGGVHDKPMLPPPFYIDIDQYTSTLEDKESSLKNEIIGPNGMKIDRMYFDRFEQAVIAYPALREQAEAGKWDEMISFIEKNILDKPEDYFTLEKLRAAVNADRRIPLREMIEKVFGLIPYFKTREQLLDEEFDRFDSRAIPDETYFSSAKTVFKAYIEDEEFRRIIESGNLAMLNVSPYGYAYRQLSTELRKKIPEYIKDFVPLNNFTN
jgi:type I restriction enzyme R subunit